ncbi:MAG: prevent-host-death protein [Cytophagales bacterium]|nr:MAG: prevent-host-death protein [Cytophagales bacterium]
MRIMTVGDLKTHFSEVLQDIQAGEEIAVAYGKRKEIVAYLIPKSARQPQKRTLGILKNKGSVSFAENFKLTEDEFLGV